MAAGSTHHCLYSGWSTGDISVRKYPGAIAFTRIPCGAHSAASALVNWCTAALDERYDACQRGWLTISADIEPTFTIVPPPRCAIRRPTARLQYQTPSTLVANTSCQAVSGVSNARPATPMPALLSNTSISPNSVLTCSTARSTSSTSATSSCTPYARMPSSLSSLAAASAEASVLAVTATA